MEANIWLWVGFNLFVIALLAIDLGVFHRKAHAVGTKEAAIWTVVWISLALLFNAVIFLLEGREPGMMFLAGYLIEKSLSVDNIFVFVMLFSFFAVPREYQHRVLFWGILGALVMRGALIGVGAYLISQFHWILYIFGAFLVFTGIRMAMHQEDDEVNIADNRVVKLVRKLIPITSRYQGDRFFIRRLGVLMATPLLMVLVIVETTDLVFALDSIPAIFAVTQDPFLVYTSNVFAILGLRSLYFLLANVMGNFRFLQTGLAVILVFVGAKMLVADIYHVPIFASLGVIAGVLTIAIVASWLFPATEPEAVTVAAD
jgi:tellurite resistance protein TerC